MRRYVVALWAALALAGCGGGDDSSPDSETEDVNAAEGYWTGNPGTDQMFMVILENGDAWAFDFHDGKLTAVLAGPVGTSAESFTWQVSRFSEGEPIVDGEIKGTVQPRESLSATMTLGTLSVDASATYDSTYDSEAAIGGHWSGEAFSNTFAYPADITIDSAGAVGLSVGPCEALGMAQTIKAGKHPLRMTLVFSGPECEFEGQTQDGILIQRPDGALWGVTFLPDDGHLIGQTGLAFSAPAPL